MHGSEVADERRVARGTSKRPRRWSAALAMLAAAALALFLLSRAGAFLILNAPERSDVIVVLNGEWQQGVHLHTRGYAPKILLDAGVDRQIYGRSEAELAAEFLRTNKLPDTEICPTTAEPPYAEAIDVQKCIDRLHAHSAVLVASNFDTRRVLAVYRKLLPQYRWSVAASSAPFHDADQYWKHRAWAKTVLNAWEQYLSWKLVDQWRGGLGRR